MRTYPTDPTDPTNPTNPNVPANTTETRMTPAPDITARAASSMSGAPSMTPPAARPNARPGPLDRHPLDLFALIAGVLALTEGLLVVAHQSGAIRVDPLVGLGGIVVAAGLVAVVSLVLSVRSVGMMGPSRSEEAGGGPS